MCLLLYLVDELNVVRGPLRRLYPAFPNHVLGPVHQGIARDPIQPTEKVGEVGVNALFPKRGEGFKKCSGDLVWFMVFRVEPVRNWGKTGMLCPEVGIIPIQSKRLKGDTVLDLGDVLERCDQITVQPRADRPVQVEGTFTPPQALRCFGVDLRETCPANVQGISQVVVLAIPVELIPPEQDWVKPGGTVR